MESPQISQIKSNKSNNSNNQIREVSSSSVLEPKMGGKRKRDANGKVIPSPSDSKPRPNRNRPGRRNGSENAKTEQNRADETLALEMAPELGLRKCGNCHVTNFDTKHVDSFSVPVPTSSQEAYKCCTACLDKIRPMTWLQQTLTH